MQHRIHKPDLLHRVSFNVRGHTTALGILETLIRFGPVAHGQLSAGNAHLYSLNYDHLLARAVEQMANAHSELIRRLRDATGSWATPAVHVSLFGSAARRDGDTHSDIDMLIVRPADLDPTSEPWRAQIDALADDVRRSTGNNAGIVEISETNLPHLAEEQRPILAELRRDAIDIAGKPTRTLLRGL